jgi:hypothetical protein
VEQGRSSIAIFSSIANAVPPGSSDGPIEQVSYVTNLDSFIASSSHNLSMLGKADVGGPFHLVKVEREFEKIKLAPYRNGFGWVGGEFTCDLSPLTVFPTKVEAELAMADLVRRLRYKAPHAIAMSTPTRPESEILTAVVDTVRDGVPHLVGSTLWRERARLARSEGRVSHAAKAASDEYLNVEFGWKPLVKDVKDFARTVLKSSQVISQYEKGSGKRQRRGMRLFTPNREPQSSQTPPFLTYPVNPFIFSPAPVNTIRTFESQMWFSGAFRYYLAPSGMERYVQLASKLYGISLTPDKLWELAPWTWALDWFGNTGDVITNISRLGSDALVMEWGYMMGHDIVTSTLSQTLTGQLMAPSTGHPAVAGKQVPLRTTERVSVIARVPGSPYSFAAEPEALSARQTAILVAVGLSHKTSPTPVF